MKRKPIIFDLDGTLADISHREHLVKGGTKDWKAFHDAVGDDLPNTPVIEIWNALKATGKFEFYIYTGRIDSTINETKDWLTKYGIIPDVLRMRPSASRIGDDELKANWLKWDFPTKEEREEILCVFEDRQKVVDMWRRKGLSCLQVAAGKF